MMATALNVNHPSRLLSDQENNVLYNVIGKKRYTLATSPVQLFSCGPNQHQWQKFKVGVACFVKDNLKKSYFIRVVDLASQSIVWEQELYNQFKYAAPRPYFHTFEADNFMAGMNFASQEEAMHFKKIIDEKLLSKLQKKNERRQTQVRRNTTRKPAGSGNVLQPITNQELNHISPSPSAADLNKKNNKGTIGKGGKKRPKLTKDDISTPSDFRHVGHIGWDPKGGFDVNNIDPQWKNLFDRIGVTEKELRDEETSKFIYDFVESHGGIEKATKELDISGTPSGPPPPPPSRAPQPPRGGPPRNAAPPPPPGHRAAPNRSAPPPPGSTRGPPPKQHGRAPPPPPQSSAPPPPPPSSRNVPPPPPSGNVPAPPPPPPPPPIGGAPPPPPPMGGVSAAPPPPPVGGGRGGLLDEIHKGKQLAKVEPNQNQPEASGRDDLLSAIRKGAQLKSVSSDDRQSATDAELEGMAGALAKALAARSAHIQQSDDDDDDDDDDFEDEDEWSD